MPEKRLPALPPGSMAAAKKSAAQQCCSPPEPHTAGLGCPAERPPRTHPTAERRNEDTEGIACPLLAQTVLVHDRLLEYAHAAGMPVST